MEARNKARSIDWGMKRSSFIDQAFGSISLESIDDNENSKTPMNTP